ncbi:MAG TPA: 2-amino-4-hydroxy-6-hydroxymethyldihydropteridine diphosphokinase [Casimicrobiaceae bacterium]|jgi:2-amino-4-hydroxy-6-hydroxymethyldihydropteridine diphosphokinase|nr:2-amino-4-hydroxy-6-hydroxymethyldihydropteridine diphosphokinase [Casimicrobiaceae bacterium]
MTSVAYVGLGSNLGHPRRRLARALTELARLPRSQLIAASRNYLTAPVGSADSQPDYVNAVAAVRTALAPGGMLRHLRAIERRHGRRRQRGERRNAPRLLDLDLLLFGRRRLSQSSLIVPHPRMHQRAFVLRPLLEIAPAATIPGRGAARAWLRAVRDQRIARTRTAFWR